MTLRAQMGEDVREMMRDGIGIGITRGGVRNAGSTASHTDPGVWICGFCHWPLDRQRDYVAANFPGWTKQEQSKFNRRNNTSWFLEAE